MAMTLTDGRGELYQWDTGRTLTVNDATVTQVHFQNRAYGRTIDVDVKDGTAIIPDELLQKAGELRVYAFSGTAESGFTKVERVLNIVRRNKPNDYMYTPTEQKSLEGLQKQIGDLSDLKTDAKTDIVSAINETATAGQTLGLTGATVGQVPAVKAVGENGVPTEWEAVEFPSGAYIVNLTMDDGGNITADKTFAEIKAASDEGKVVNAKFAGAIVPLGSISDSEAIFAMTQANSSVVSTASLTCTSDNVWSMSQDGFRITDGYSLGISGASVGQIVKIKTVDSSGVPTEWEPADMPSGGGDNWKLLVDFESTEEIAANTGMVFDTADDGTPITAKEIIIDWYCPAAAQAAYATFKVNNVQCTGYAHSNLYYFWSGGLVNTADIAAALHFRALGDVCLLTMGKKNTMLEPIWFAKTGAFDTITSLQLTMFGGTYPVGLKIKILGR